MIPKCQELRFETTLTCYMHCEFCPRDQLTRKAPNMSLDKFKFYLDKILDESDQYTICSFSGFGEPTMDFNINEKIRYAVERGLEVNVLMNAELLTAGKLEVFHCLGVNTVRASYNNDSIQEKMLDIASVAGSLKLVLTRIQQDEDLTEWIKFWEPKVHMVEVWKPHNWCDGKSYRKLDDDKAGTCGRPFTGPLQIQVDGTVNMCCFDFDGKLTLGDLNTQSLEEIFDSELATKIRKHHLDASFENSGLICERCDQRNKNKDDILVYSSKYTKQERINKLSTSLLDI